MSDPILECTGVLKLKLGACVSGPTKRMQIDLKAFVSLCNGAKNHMVRTWERWREDHHEWEPGDVKTKRGKARREHPCLSYECEESLYQKAGEAYPDVARILISTMRGEVVDQLKAKLPYNHEGKAKFRYEGILLNEVARDCYRAPVIPVPNGSAVFCYDGAFSRVLSSGIMERIRKHEASAVLRFPLWSETSGRAVKDVIVRLEVADLPRGQRHVLKKIARGDWKMSDSELVLKNGVWWYHLTYKQPKQDLGLPTGHVATLLLMGADDKRPIGIESSEKRWGLGDVVILEREFERYRLRLAALRSRYRKDVRGQAGHGQGRFYERIRPANDLRRNLLERFTQRLVSEAIKFCTRFACGTILYREPSINLRGLSWFAKRRIEFAWDRFGANLAHKCKLYGITLNVERMGCAEWRASGAVVDTLPGTARNPETYSSNGDAPNENGTEESPSQTRMNRSQRARPKAQKPAPKRLAGA